jgi:3-oxoadipate enol-lactonase
MTRLILRALALVLASSGYSGSLHAQPVARDPVALSPAEVTNVLHYAQAGQGDPVVLLQGANLPMEMWDAQVQSFIAEFRVVRFDVRGFGGSGPRDSVPYQSHADLRALLDHLGIARAHLVGLSLGGRIAVDFALTYPDRVQSLVLSAPGLSGYMFDEASMREWTGPLIDAVRSGDSVRAADMWLKSGFMATAMQNSELAPRLTQLARSNARVFRYADLEVPLSPPAVDRLSEIHAPTLLLLGDKDVQDEHRIVERLHEKVASSERVVFPGVGHVTNLEAPQDFNRVVVAFLRKHAIGSRALTSK